VCKNVLVYSEDRELVLQLLGKGRELTDKAGGELYALLLGSDITDAAELFGYGADMVYVVDDPKLAQFGLEPYRVAVLEAAGRASPGFVLIGATKRGKELAARVAAALDTGCMTECVSLEMDEGGGLMAERLTYGGSTISTQVSRREPHVVTVSPRAFKKPEPSPGEGEVVRLDVEIPDSRVSVIERREKGRGDLGLEEAPVIVSAGRGFKEQEDLRLLEELAEVMGAKVGCTRPIAADLGWMEEWIGISGRKVSPKLYVACGISGTIQHAAGIRDSQIIVSINSSETANIHEMSDYSLVGDVYTVLPALTRALKEKVG
jgi:electron transfer flavoprotein alpha subunit